MTYSDAQTSYVRRFARSLLGKPDISIPDVPARTAQTIASDLAAIPETDWWKYAFSREPMNGRFTDGQRREMYGQAVECGQRKADEFKQKYGPVKPEEIARTMGIDVCFPHMPQGRSRILFAEFKEPDTICVYQDGIDKGRTLLAEEGVRQAMGEDTDLSQLLIAHELFHVCELRDPSIWTKTYSINLWKIGRFVNRSPVMVLSEIAAMAFASRLNNVNFSAYVLDAFLVFGYSPLAVSALYEEMRQGAGRKPSRPDGKQ
ncbi:hypothetical protein [uncultured Dubosiella sp.]|uniref:hypothetical protein n=2 Tax=Erysipelotrichaceae TaxID=128827 RepID=UPI00262309FC|nr:hypothetical protein [uncultured Dubosiella sp.]